MKPKKVAKKAHPKKVFDVMRPGKTAAGATSRPVIVGHKPQIKDPMMSERDEPKRPLLDSKQKVALNPAALAEQSTEQAAETPSPTPTAAPEAVAAVALADTVETPATPAAAPLETPKETPAPVIATPQQTPTPQDPVEGSPKPLGNVPETKDSTGIIFEDIPTADVGATPPEKAPEAPAEPAEPLPVLPPEEMPKAQVFVAHHSSSTSGLKVFLILLLVVVLAVAAFDIMLDAGFVTLDSVPHTNFF